MPYDPDLDTVYQTVNEDEGLTLIVASYNDGPVRVRIKRRKGGKTYDTTVGIDEIDDLVDMLEQVEDPG